MKSIKFDQVTSTLTRPHDMSDKECGPLSVFTDGRVCVSKWEMTWKERFHCLFRGYVWLRVHSGHTQPPVALDAQRTVLSPGDVNWEREENA